MTQSIVPGEAVYGEKKVSVEVSCLSVCRIYIWHVWHVWHVWHQVCLCGTSSCVCDKYMQSMRTMQQSTAC